jgi:hypothetical protein
MARVLLGERKEARGGLEGRREEEEEIAEVIMEEMWGMEIEGEAQL